VRAAAAVVGAGAEFGVGRLVAGVAVAVANVTAAAAVGGAGVDDADETVTVDGAAVIVGGGVGAHVAVHSPQMVGRSTQVREVGRGNAGLASPRPHTWTVVVVVVVVGGHDGDGYCYYYFPHWRRQL